MGTPLYQPARSGDAQSRRMTRLGFRVPLALAWWVTILAPPVRPAHFLCTHNIADIQQLVNHHLAGHSLARFRSG